MRAVGLITEYNPFHNGHLYHLGESKKAAQADVAVAVMSGHFLQRGEPALLDKWLRARMAIAAGVDVVVELPLPWACSSAPDFAMGGIQALSALTGVDTVCFGSEAGCLEPLQRCAGLLLERGPVLEERTARLLRKGVSYPDARARVLAEEMTNTEDVTFLGEPNNILGIEYIKAIRQTDSGLSPLTVARIGAGYHATTAHNGVASATGIRTMLKAGQRVDHFVPGDVMAILEDALNSGFIYSPEHCFRLLQAQIFRSAGALDCYWLVDAGMENRLQDAAGQAGDLEELVNGIKSRQFTRTRIQRMLMAVLLGLRATETRKLLTHEPRYLHLLAANRQGQRFLAATRRQRTLPLIQNFSRVYAILKRRYGADSEDYGQALEQLRIELTATRIYGLLQNEKPEGLWNRDFYEPLIKG